jgi:S1-C subfamily serine protease
MTAIESKRPGQTVTLTVRRAGTDRDVAVELGTDQD